MATSTAKTLLELKKKKLFCIWNQPTRRNPLTYNMLRYNLNLVKGVSKNFHKRQVRYKHPEAPAVCTFLIFTFLMAFLFRGLCRFSILFSCLGYVDGRFDGIIISISA